MILADTSAWIEHDRGTGSAVALRMRALTAAPDRLAVTEPVRTELLAGAKGPRQEDVLRRLLSTFTLLPFDGASDFDAAARIHRRCRTEGITPRGMIDCMIAAVAWRHDARLLTTDRDLRLIAGIHEIALDPASAADPAGA